MEKKYKFDHVSEVTFPDFMRNVKVISNIAASAIKKLIDIGFVEFDPDAYYTPEEEPQISNLKGMILITDSDDFGACHVWKSKGGYSVHLTDLISISDRFYLFVKLEDFVNFVKNNLKNGEEV